MLKQISNVVSAISKNKIKFIILYLIVCTIIYVVVRPSRLFFFTTYTIPYPLWIFEYLFYLFCGTFIFAVFFPQLWPFVMWILKLLIYYFFGGIILLKVYT